MIRLIIAAFALLPFAASAGTMSNVDAGAISAVSGLAQGRLAWVSAKNVSRFLSQRAVSNPIIAKALTDHDIREITTLVENSWYPRAGIGQVGGAQIEITYDAGQAERMIGADSASKVSKKVGNGAAVIQNDTVGGAVDAAEKAKPVMKTEYIYPRLEGSARDLTEKLNYIKDNGGVVSKVEVQSLIRRAGMRAVSGVLTVYFVANTASNVYRAWAFDQRSLQATSAKCAETGSSECSVTGWNAYKWLWSSADAVFYAFQPDSSK